jgi:nitric-oxide synthase
MEYIYREAEVFLKTAYRELGIEDKLYGRLREVKEQVKDTGFYIHTYEELAYGAKMAWRNSNKCIGRLFWNSLEVRDYRHLSEEEEVFSALESHIDFAENQGKIRPTISVFAPHTTEEAAPLRIWNHQLIRYAGYSSGSGITGDPMSFDFTRICEGVGWEGEKTPFDILPLVIQLRGEQPAWKQLNRGKILEVSIGHPEYEGIESLGLRWYALPAISDMLLEIGGIKYPAAPFNGWYMGTEIGARNLADEDRYNMLPAVAEAIGIEPKRNSSLWKDRALVELNRAVLHSYQEAGVSIVDHHTAAEQFRKFEKLERKHGRQLTGDWTWLIPPVSPAATHIFHSEYNNEVISPNYFSQAKPYYVI